MNHPSATLAAALELSLAVAAESARIIRESFHEPGGPKSTTSEHALVDEQVAVLIAARLRDAFPGWGFVMEEEGVGVANRPATDPGRHVWLVDPHDGTRAFLRGHRGSAISIAVLRDGVPVLGVVNAPTARNGHGDVIWWAEGCGPLRRNGEVVDHPGWSAEPHPHSVVLTSHDSDRRSVRNALWVSPGRFRSMPSIAYRLALVAAGEADAALSLSGPTAYDFAAGHALLRAVGGDLYSLHGEPITYDPATGSSSVSGECIGGGRGMVHSLLLRDPLGILAPSPSRPHPPRLGLLRPRAGDHMGDAGMLDRAVGALLGLVAGDNLGALCEFKPRPWIAERYPSGPRELEDGGTHRLIAGQGTDDTEMALALARSIVAQGAYDPLAALGAYVDWAASGPFDIGGTIGNALKVAADAIAESADPLPALAALAHPLHQANGALMRVAPIGILGALQSVAEVEDNAACDAQLTHPNDAVVECNMVFASALAHAIRTGESPRAVYHFACSRAESLGVAPPVRDALRRAATGDFPPHVPGAGGWVVLALELAFHHLLHFARIDDALARVVAFGADTDTTAAITGALLGAVHGGNALPPQWVRMILSCRPMDCGATTDRDIRHPRPETYWPVDVPELAERVLLLGARREQATS